MLQIRKTNSRKDGECPCHLMLRISAVPTVTRMVGVLVTLDAIVIVFDLADLIQATVDRANHL